MAKQNVVAADGSAGILDTALTKKTSHVVLAAVGGALAGAFLGDVFNLDYIRKRSVGDGLSATEEAALRQEIASLRDDSLSKAGIIENLRRELENVEREDGVHQSHVDTVLVQLNVVEQSLREIEAKARSLSEDNLRKDARIRELEALSGLVSVLREEKNNLENQLRSISIEDGINQGDLDDISAALKSQLGIDINGGSHSADIVSKITDFRAVVENLRKSKSPFDESQFLEESNIISPEYGGLTLYNLHKDSLSGPVTLRFNRESTLEYGSTVVRHHAENASHFPSLIAALLLEKQTSPTLCELAGSSNDWLTFKGTAAYDGDLNAKALNHFLAWLGDAARGAKEAGEDSVRDFIDSICRGAYWANTYASTRGEGYKRAQLVGHVMENFDYNGVGAGTIPYTGGVTKVRIIAISALVFSCLDSGRTYEVTYG